MVINMQEYFSVYLYLALVCVVTLATFGVSFLFSSADSSPTKYRPYESGMQIDNKLLQERFPIRHYLVGLIFLVFDIEIIFLYPWATVAKHIGPFAFYELFVFLLLLVTGFIYVWRKGGLKWE